MRRILCYMVSVLCIFSCKISDGERRPVSSDALEAYGAGLLAENVCMPLNLAELVWAFDGYLSLPDDEKETDVRFYGKVSVAGENLYAISDGTDGYIRCVVDTHGSSLASEGSVWEIGNLEGRVDNRTHGMQLECYFDFEDKFAISRLGSGLELRILDDVITSMQTMKVCMAAEEGSEEVFLIDVAGMERSNSFYAVSSTEAPLRVKRDKADNEWVFEGVFQYNTFRLSDEKMLDCCSMIFRPGYLTKFEISR